MSVIPSLQKLTTLLLAGVLLGFIFKTLDVILQPLFIAIFIIYLILPLKIRLAQCKISHTGVNTLVLSLVLGTLFGLGWLFSKNMQILAQNYPTYHSQFISIVGNVATQLERLDPMLRERIHQIDIPLNILAKYLSQSVGSFFSGLGFTFVVSFYLIFILLELDSLPHRLEAAFGKQQQKTIEAALQKINQGILAYIRVKTLVSFLAALCCTVVMVIFGVDLWLFWGFLIFLGNFIPYIGSMVAILFPSLIFLLQTASPWQCALLALILAIVKNAIEAFIEPRMAARTLNLSPLMVIVSLAFWAWLWGVAGMILAIPMMVVFKSILEAFPETQGYARLMEEKPRN